MGRFKHPQLIYGKEYERQSKRDRAYPYVLGGAIALLVVLVVMQKVLEG